MKKIKKKLFNHHKPQPPTCNDLVSIETPNDDVINPNYVEPQYSAAPPPTNELLPPPPPQALLRHKGSGDSLLAGISKKFSTSVSNLTEEVPRRRPPRPSSVYDVTKDEGHQSLGNRLFNMVMHPGNHGDKEKVKAVNYSEMDPNSQIADMFLEHVRIFLSEFFRKYYFCSN